MTEPQRIAAAFRMALFIAGPILALVVVVGTCITAAVYGT